MTTKARINPYEVDTEVDLGVDTQADTALPDEIGLSLQDSMTEKSSLPFVLQFPQSQDVRKKNNTTKTSDNSACHWAGEVINEQDQERFYASFAKNGEEYSLDESVLATSPNKKLPTIGQIHCLWEDKKTGKRIVELKVYYRPEETKEGRKPFQAPKELLDSNYFAQFTIDQVTKKCSVESYEKFRRRRDFPDDVYYFQDFYDYREQQTIEETPTDNFSFRRRIVNIALNSKSPPKAKEQLRSSTKQTANNATKSNNNNTAKAAISTEKVPTKNSQQNTEKQKSNESEPEIDDDATIKLTMPPIEDDGDFDFGVIEELAGITNNNTSKNSTNVQEASTLITTQRDVERKKSPSMSDDETTSGGSDKRSKVSPKKAQKSSEFSTSNSNKTLTPQPTTRSSKPKGRSSPLMTDDSEDMIMKELEIEEEEVTQAKSRSRITRQASTMDHSVNNNSVSKSKAPTPKKQAEEDGSDEEFADPEEEKPKPKPRGRQPAKKQAPKKQGSEEEEVEHDEPASEEVKPKPKPKTRAQAKKPEPKKKPRPEVVVEESDEEETAILEALERETEELSAVRTNSVHKKKLRAYTDNDEEEHSDGEKSGPSSPTKITQTRARGKATKTTSETPRKSAKSAFEFEGSEEKSDEGESPKKKRANRRLSVNSNDSKARDKKAAAKVEEEAENEDSISDSEEREKRTSPRKNKGPVSKREKIKEMLQRYPKLSELDNNDPFEDYDKANDIYDAATEPVVVNVEKFNGRTMKQALDTEDNDFELDNFLKDTPKTKRQKQLTPLVTKNDFGSRLGSLSNRMKYYQNWDIAETKEVIDVDEDSQDFKKSSGGSIGSYSSRPKNKSAQMKLDFAPVIEKMSSPTSVRSSSGSRAVRKSPYFSSNNQPTSSPAASSKVKSEHDPFISSILSKYDEDEPVADKDKEIIDLSTQRPASQVVPKKSLPKEVAADLDLDEFLKKASPKKDMEDFNDFDVESMLREVGEMGGDDSEPKNSAPVIAIDESSLDVHKNNVSKTNQRKKVDTSPSSDNNSESSTTRDSKKRKRGSDERKQRTLGMLNIIGAPEPNLLAEPPKKKRRLSEHTDRVKSKLRYGIDEEEVFMDKDESEEMDEEMRDFIVEDGVELSQYESQALPIDAVAEDEEEGSARDEAASQISVKDFADKLVKEGETKFLSTTFKMSDAFKIFIQYLISCMLDPNFAAEVERKQDDYFRPAVRKIHDDLFSKKEVIIRSSAWNAYFKSNLDRLPVFRSYKMSHPDGECDACKRSMHTASWQVVLEGVPYDATSYWKDGPTAANPNPQREPEQYTYNLGRFCHKRTELFHRLHHYKIRLNEQITEKMNSLPSSLSENEVIDTVLDDQLWINKMWKQFQGLREDALEFGTKGSEDGH